MSGPAGNPLKSDPFLKKLLEESLRIESQQDFDEWKGQFVGRLESILEPGGIVKAQEAYSSIGKDMHSLAATVFLLQNQISLGRLSSHQVSVKGRKSLNETKLAAIEATEKIEAWLPSNLVDEGKLGYNKYQLGVVLVKDAFEVYMTMALCRDMMKHALETTVGTTDRQAWQAVKYFERQIQRFCDVMADLGLYDLMDKSFQTRSTSYKSEMRQKVGVAEVQPMDASAGVANEVEDKDGSDDSDDDSESDESNDEILIMVRQSPRRRASLFGNMPAPEPIVVAVAEEEDVPATPISCGSGKISLPRRRRSLNGNMQPEEAPDYGEYNDQRMPADLFLSLAESYSSFHFSMSSFRYDPEMSMGSFQFDPDDGFFSDDDDDDDSSGNNELQDVPEESELQDVPEGAEVEPNKAEKKTKKKKDKKKKRQGYLRTVSQLGGATKKPPSKLKKNTKNVQQQLAANRPTNRLKGPQRQKFDTSGINRPTNKLIGQKLKTQPELREPKAKTVGRVKGSVLSLPFRPWHRSQNKEVQQQPVQQVKGANKKKQAETSSHTHISAGTDHTTPSVETSPLPEAIMEEAPPLEESSASSRRHSEESNKIPKKQDEEQQQAPATTACRRKNSISKMFGGLIKQPPQSQDDAESAIGHQLEEPEQNSVHSPKQDKEQPQEALSMLATNHSEADSSSSSQPARPPKKLHRSNSLVTMKPTEDTDLSALTLSKEKRIKRQKSAGAKLLTQTLEKPPKESHGKPKKPKAEAQPPVADSSSNIEAAASPKKIQRRNSLFTMKPPEQPSDSSATLPVPPRKIQRRNSALATTTVPQPKEDVDSNGPVHVQKKKIKRQKSLPVEPMQPSTQEPEPPKEFQGKLKKSKADEQQPLAAGLTVSSSAPKKQIKRQKALGPKPTQPAQQEKPPKSIAEEQQPPVDVDGSNVTLSPRKIQRRNSLATAQLPPPPQEQSSDSSTMLIASPRKIQRRNSAMATTPLPRPKEEPLQVLKKRITRQKSAGAKPTTLEPSTKTKPKSKTTGTAACKNINGGGGGGGGGYGGGFRLGAVQCSVGGSKQDDEAVAEIDEEEDDGDGDVTRWDLRFRFASPTKTEYNRLLRHDDCVLVPMFGPSDDFTMYHQLIRDIRLLQRQGIAGVQWTMCHDSVGKHYVCPNPAYCPSFKEICTKVCTYFHIQRDTLQFTLNWYKKGAQNFQKPRHDEEAYANDGQQPHPVVRNITVGITFGAEHELSLEKKDSSLPGKDDDDEDDKDKKSSSSDSDSPGLAARISVPQCNNCVFTIGRDVNIRFQHGIVEAAATTTTQQQQQEQQEQQQQQQQQECVVGRIGIILWGQIKSEQVKEDKGSPALLKREKSPDMAAAAAAETETDTCDSHHDRDCGGCGGRMI